MLRAEPLRLRFEATLLSRRLSPLLDDDDELELDEDDELEELEREPDDELLSEELLFENFEIWLYIIIIIIIVVNFCFRYEKMGNSKILYLPLLLEIDPRRLFSRDRLVFRDLSLSFDFTEDGDSERIRLALCNVNVVLGNL